MNTIFLVFAFIAYLVGLFLAIRVAYSRFVQEKLRNEFQFMMPPFDKHKVAVLISAEVMCSGIVALLLYMARDGVGFPNEITWYVMFGALSFLLHLLVLLAVTQIWVVCRIIR